MFPNQTNWKQNHLCPGHFPSRLDSEALDPVKRSYISYSLATLPLEWKRKELTGCWHCCDFQEHKQLNDMLYGPVPWEERLMMNGTDRQSANGLSCLGRDQTNEAGRSCVSLGFWAVKWMTQEKNSCWRCCSSNILAAVMHLVECHNYVGFHVLFPKTELCFHLVYGYGPFL